MLCAILPHTHTLSRAFQNTSINESLFKCCGLDSAVLCAYRCAPSVVSFFPWNHHNANAQGNSRKFSKKKSLDGVVAIASRFQLSFEHFTWKISFVFIRNSKRKISKGKHSCSSTLFFPSRFIHLVHQLFAVWYLFYSFTKYCINTQDFIGGEKFEFMFEMSSIQR